MEHRRANPKTIGQDEIYTSITSMYFYIFYFINDGSTDLTYALSDKQLQSQQASEGKKASKGSFREGKHVGRLPTSLRLECHLNEDLLLSMGQCAW